MSKQRVAHDVSWLCAQSVTGNVSGLTEVELRALFELVLHHCLCAVEAFAVRQEREEQRLDPASRN